MSHESYTNRSLCLAFVLILGLWFFWIVKPNGQTVIVQSFLLRQDCEIVRGAYKRSLLNSYVSPCLDNPQLYLDVMSDLKL